MTRIRGMGGGISWLEERGMGEGKESCGDSQEHEKCLGRGNIWDGMAQGTLEGRRSYFQGWRCAEGLEG